MKRQATVYGLKQAGNREERVRPGNTTWCYLEDVYEDVFLVIYILELVVIGLL